MEETFPSLTIFGPGHERCDLITHDATTSSFHLGVRTLESGSLGSEMCTPPLSGSRPTLLVALPAYSQTHQCRRQRVKYAEHAASCQLLWLRNITETTFLEGMR